MNRKFNAIHKGIKHENCKISKCGKYVIASNNYTKFKIENCTIENETAKVQE